MSFATMFVSTVLLAAVTTAPAIDIIYEAVSATATVGLSRNLTPFLGLFGKIIIIVTMYFGRIGPISLAFAFKAKKETTNLIKNPTEEISVG
jgi:trk system potassium uptake protein TrkH